MKTVNRTPKELCELFGISDKDFKMVQSIQKQASSQINKMVDNWYIWLKTTPEYQEFFFDKQSIKRAHDLQIEYWNIFFQAEVDENYYESRIKVGEVHARIGLPLDIYLAGVDHFLGIFIQFIDDLNLPKAKFNGIRRAMNKLVHLDMSLIVQTYENIIKHKIAAQSKSLMEMSTPVTQLWNGLILLPLVGLIDSRRAEDVMNSILSKISETQAQAFILDISGVAVVDTAVANHLIKISKATSLMGCECIISGISPSIAQTIVELGIDVGTVQTTANMRAALEKSFNLLGMEIIQQE
jgi:rsbT co-antagonist protein RsbR